MICVASQSSETTQHLLSVVDKQEALRSEARDRYLQLMRAHIDKQLECVAKQEKLFQKKREKREKSQKASFVSMHNDILCMQGYLPP